MSSSHDQTTPVRERPSVRFHGQRKWGIDDLPDLRRVAMGVLRAEGATGPVDIIFQDPQAQRALNLQWRGLDRTTDVLSFPYEEPGLFGELYIDPVLAAEQATRYRHSLHREMRRLIVHGCLHLCGYDHGTTPERRRMRALENQYDPPESK
ncbi:MAG: rRNA maturation RNase YbeY [Fibrobacteria bacterium]|nr:rRNA maturation RNase YbeY [Fibrobacteria bacterium]